MNPSLKKSTALFVVYVFVTVFAGVARAQGPADLSMPPAAGPSVEADPAPPLPPALSVPMRDSGKVPYRSLTPEERKILFDGPISDGQYIAGGVVGTFFGLGIGQAIEGRYMDTGWIFTVGEIASATLLVVGAVNCVYSIQGNSCSSGGGEVVLGYVGLLGFRIWEIVDVWAVPPGINRRYRDLRERVEDPPHVSLGIVPVTAVGVAMAPGLGFQYSF